MLKPPIGGFIFSIYPFGNHLAYLAQVSETCSSRKNLKRYSHL